jgi:transcriptional regulator with XRE-family HTH domain/tetratricopeptide (TPR) repeat protein
MKTEEDDPEVLRLVVVFLRFYARMTQAELGRAARVRQSYISELESGQRQLTEEVLRRIAVAADVPWPLVVHLRRFAAAFLSVTAEGAAFEEAADSLGRSRLIDPAHLVVSAYLMEDAAETVHESPEEVRLQATRVWNQMAGLPPHRRRQAIRLSPKASRNWALAERICEASVRAAASDPQEALALADLALLIAERVEGSEDWRRRVQGFAWAHMANARRVANDLFGADEAFARAWDLWRAGAPSDPDLLPEWRMLDLEASLRRAERRFAEALELLDRAFRAAGASHHPIALGRILLNKEHVCAQMGDLEGALAALREAAPFVDTSGNPRLLFALRFNMADNLCQLDRHAEAADLLPVVRELAERLGNELDLVRVVWLTARVATGRGLREEAIDGLEQVRRDFTARGLPYDAALSSLDLAVLYLKEGRTGEVKALAREMAPIFQAQGIAREALASLSLFRDAAQQETATVELACRVIAEIERTRRSTLRPEGRPQGRE